MSWMGKMIGGAIGFALGGPVGAVAGAAFGHMFDDENNQTVETVYHTLKSGYVSDSDRHYTALGCSKSDSDAQIKSRYRKLVRDHHPDTIASKGLPDALIASSQNKFREIQEAYEVLRKERNM